MATRTVVLGLTFALAMGTATEATSREVRFKVKCSGTSISTVGDTNHDDLHAGLGTVVCMSTFGRGTSQGVGEAKVVGPGTCSNRHPGIILTLLPGTGQSQFQGTQWPLYVDSDGNGFAAQEETSTGNTNLREH